LRCLSELSVECLVGTFFSSIDTVLGVEMVVLLGICLSSQKPGTRSRCLRVGIDSGPSARHILSKPIASNMPSMTVQETVAGTEAGKLQTELRDVFSKILGHARRIDMTLALGDTTEALGQVRELELYLERGLVVLSRPLTQEP